MSWLPEGPLGRTLHDLLRLRLRAERVQLAQKLRLLESQLGPEAAEPVRRVRNALAAHPLLGRDTSLRVRPTPPVTIDTPIRRIAVRTRPGSLF